MTEFEKHSEKQLHSKSTFKKEAKLPTTNEVPVQNTRAPQKSIFDDLTNTSLDGNTYWQDFKIYVGRIRQFTKHDWIIYSLWVGMMLGLFFSLATFVSVGRFNDSGLPFFTWNIPIGALIFTTAIAIDTIGHRTIYREELRKGESLVHGVTIFCGVTSIMFLCFAKDYPETFRYPALSLLILSFFYSAIDEALHWVRYFKHKSDRIEMWSHFGIFLGHSIMSLSWWFWFDQGYLGVEETFDLLKM